MAQYRLTAKTFINGTLHDIGDVVPYDGAPGSSLEPLAGRTEPAPAAAPGAAAGHPAPDPDTSGRTDIPDDWQSQGGLARINLARALGAPKGRLDAKAADTFITAEVEKRKAASST